MNDSGLSTNSTTAEKSLNPPALQERQPPPPHKKDMKIITQNIRSFNPIINSAKQRKTDKFKKIEILLKEERPDLAILTETRHYKEENKSN